jgi:hypothetical protein
MKIAFLFLCRTEILFPVIWQKYFNSSDKDKYNIYVHPDVDKNITDEFFKKFEITNKRKKDHTHTVESRVELLKQASIDSENMFFVFVSEDSVPLQSFDKLYSYLETRDFTHTFWYSEDLSGRCKDCTHKHGDWMIINRKHTLFLLSKEHELQNFYNGTITSESYIVSILAKYNLESEIYDKDHQLFLEDWSGYKNIYPFKLSDNDFDYLRGNYNKWVEKNAFFYRKIINPCELVLNFLTDKIISKQF